jgi:CRP/FNR family transcriptional regulator, cyclic AMP receptor protein
MPTVLDLCAGMPLETVEAGAVLLDEGTRSGRLYVLVSGTVEVVKGDVQITTVSEPGAFLGEISALLDIPHMATVRAVERSTVRVATDPRAFLGSHPQIALAVARLLAKRLHFVSSYLVDVKRQFEDHENHLGIVDEVLETLVHHQEPDAEPGSDRHPDPKVD